MFQCDVILYKEQYMYMYSHDSSNIATDSDALKVS